MARARGGELIGTAPLRYVGKPAAANLQEWRAGFVTAEYAGTGLMLIARGALDKLAQAHPELRITAAHATPDAPGAHLYALFDTGIDHVTGHYLSEDYVFCARWRALGGKIWLDTQSRLTHTGPHDFTGDPGCRMLK